MNAARASIATLGFACLLVACSHSPKGPAGFVWGLPVYPGAALVGKSTSHASFVLYRTNDAAATVDAWYAAELPKSASHAADLTHERSTFALFDVQGRRTVHIERDGATTEIMLTDLKL